MTLRLIAVLVLLLMVGCSLPVKVYKAVVTPDITRCLELEDKTLSDVQAVFGPPVSVTTLDLDKKAELGLKGFRSIPTPDLRKTPAGDYVLLYRKGNLIAIAVSDSRTPDAQVKSISCFTETE